MQTAIGVLVKVGGPSSTTKQKRQAAMGFAQFSMEPLGQEEISVYKASCPIPSALRENIVCVVRCRDELRWMCCWIWRPRPIDSRSTTPCSRSAIWLGTRKSASSS